jgi:hypothetical protein
MQLEDTDTSTIIVTPTLRHEIAAEFDAVVEQAVEGMLKQLAVLHGLKSTPDGHSLADVLVKAQELLKTDPVSLATDMAALVIQPLFPNATIEPGRIVPKDGHGFGIALVVREKAQDEAQLPLPLDTVKN